MSPYVLVAEADGNRTRQAGDARLNGFEDLNSPSPTVTAHHAVSLTAQVRGGLWPTGHG
jgi:hypothetical protein